MIDATEAAPSGVPIDFKKACRKKLQFGETSKLDLRAHFIQDGNQSKQ